MEYVEKATISEYDKVAYLCQLAEAGSENVVPFQKIFNLSDKETKELFLNLAKYEEDDIPYSFSSYYFLKDDKGNILGGCSAWIEDNFPTEKIILQIISEILGFEKISKSIEKIKLASELSLRRTPNTLQLECIAIFPEYRGKGLVKKLLSNVIDTFKSKVKKSEIIVMGNNKPAIKAYSKLGFDICDKVHCNNTLIFDIYGGDTKVKMCKNV